MVQPFQFVMQTAQVQWDAEAGFLDRLRTSAQVRGDDGHLKLNTLASNTENVLLNSPTGRTVIQVSTERAILTTSYFGEFLASEEVPARTEYTQNKLRSLLQLLIEAGACLLYFELSNVARASVDSTSEADSVRRAVARSLGASAVLPQGEEPFDFSIRVSRQHGQDTFSNVHLNWYQTRSIAIPSGVTFTRFRDWDMSLIQEGLEFRYDRNNKLGLLGGRRDWSVDVFLRIAREAMADMIPTLARVDSSVRAARGQLT